MIVEIVSTIINLIGTLADITYIFGAVDFSAICEYARAEGTARRVKPQRTISALNYLCIS